MAIYDVPSLDPYPRICTPYYCSSLNWSCLL